MGDLGFRHNGSSLKIIQFADLHCEDNFTLAKNVDLVSQLLDIEHPDLVIFSGDQISGSKLGNVSGSYEFLWTRMLDPLISRKINWITILGNHDREADLSPMDIFKLDSSYNLSYTLKTPYVNPGNGLDYILPVYFLNATDPFLWLILMDSGRLECNHREDTAGCIEPENVAWFSETFVPSLHKNATSLFFVHQPFPQYNTLYSYKNTFGSGFESVSCPTFDSGMYSALPRNVFAVSIGHDHNNDYYGKLDLDLKPTMYYGRKTGYGSYGPDYFDRGARLFEYTCASTSGNCNSQELKSWIRTSSGIQVVQELHPPLPLFYLPCGFFNSAAFYVYIVLPLSLVVSTMGFIVLLWIFRGRLLRILRSSSYICFNKYFQSNEVEILLHTRGSNA